MTPNARWRRLRAVSRVEDLKAQLAAHRPSTDRESEFVARMLELLGAGETAFSRDHYRPGHFTASAFVLSPSRRELLLILHAKLGLWLQPGGHVEPDDRSLHHAAIREVREEVGLVDLEPLGSSLLDVDIHDIPASATAPSHLHFDVRFLFATATAELRPADDARAARWVDLNDPTEWRSDESVMRAVRRVREPEGL
jgi:8-oxo-dGTP pyrophosphatase MutT (NUDIX family)